MGNTYSLLYGNGVWLSGQDMIMAIIILLNFGNNKNKHVLFVISNNFINYAGFLFLREQKMLRGYLFIGINTRWQLQIYILQVDKDKIFKHKYKF